MKVRRIEDEIDAIIFQGDCDELQAFWPCSVKGRPEKGPYYVLEGVGRWVWTRIGQYLLKKGDAPVFAVDKDEFEKQFVQVKE